MSSAANVGGRGWEGRRRGSRRPWAQSDVGSGDTSARPLGFQVLGGGKIRYGAGMG